MEDYEKKTYSKCYWNNLDSIYIVTHRAQTVKLSEIFKSNDGSWTIISKIMTNVEFDAYAKERTNNFSPYREVQDWIFRRAFASIYLEMDLEFKFCGKFEQSQLLANLFTISDEEKAAASLIQVAQKIKNFEGKK